jgi:hypothetical protein
MTALQGHRQTLGRFYINSGLGPAPVKRFHQIVRAGMSQRASQFASATGQAFDRIGDNSFHLAFSLFLFDFSTCGTP